MSLIDRGRRLFTQAEEPIQSRDDRFFQDLSNRTGKTPPKQTQDSFASKHQPVDFDELEPPPAEFDFSADDTRRFRDAVADLQRELPPIPVAPLPIEGEIINEFEKIAVATEMELVEFRKVAVETIQRGLDLAAEMRQRGRDHGAEVRDVLSQAAALCEKYHNFSVTQGEGPNAAKSQTTDSHALGQASSGSDHRAPADAQQPAGEAEQRGSVRELHRDADRGPQGPRLAQRAPEVLPQT